MGEIDSQLADRWKSAFVSVAKKLKQNMEEQIGTGLTLGQFYILGALLEKGPVTPSELADRFEVQRSAITAMVDRLVRHELVTRHHDEKHRRNVVIQITEHGRDSYHQAEKQNRQIIADLLGRYTPDEVETFVNLLEKAKGIVYEER